MKELEKRIKRIEDLIEEDTITYFRDLSSWLQAAVFYIFISMGLTLFFILMWLGVMLL